MQLVARVTAILTLSATFAFGQQAKPILTGNWQFNAAKSKVHAGAGLFASVSIKQADSTVIQITRTGKDAKGAEATVTINCSTTGKDCDITGGTTSFWYSDGVLTELDVMGDVAMRYDFTLAADGKSLQVDISCMTDPKAPTDTLVLDKAVPGT